MTITSGSLYEFAFRGFLAEAALDKDGRIRRQIPEEFDPELARRLGIELLDEEAVQGTRAMAVVYAAIAAFEVSARKLVAAVLLEAVGEKWWEQGVSENIRRRAESRRTEEQKVKWHGQRGDSLLDYTDLGDLAKIIRNNWQHFEPHLRSLEWASAILDVVERSRNVIMHSSPLSREDIERVGINIRDWVKQVGG